MKSEWLLRRKPYVQDSLAGVYVMAAIALYGSRWWLAAAASIGFARLVLLRMIRREENAREADGPA